MGSGHNKSRLVLFRVTAAAATMVVLHKYLY